MTIKHIFPLLCLLSLTTCRGNSVTAEKQKSAPTQPMLQRQLKLHQSASQSMKQKLAQPFRIHSLSYKFKNANDNEIVNEYFLAAESPDRWTKMVSVRHFLNINDPEAAVGDLAKVIKQQNPDTPYASGKRDLGLFISRCHKISH